MCKCVNPVCVSKSLLISYSGQACACLSKDRLIGQVSQFGCQEDRSAVSMCTDTMVKQTSSMINPTLLEGPDININLQKTNHHLIR